MADYSSLTEFQKRQVLYLFADDVFGTDARDYDYEIEGQSVTGRLSLMSDDNALHAKKNRNIKASVVVREVPAEFVTDAMKRDAEVAIQEMARLVMDRLMSIPPPSSLP